MALIRCPECSAEISDQASCCPKCGVPIAVQNQSIANADAVAYEGSVNITPTFVVKNRRNLRVIIALLIIAAIAIAIAFVVLQNGESNSKGVVKHGVYCDAYDYDGDGWVDRVYDRELGQWWQYQFRPGEFSMDDAE